MSKDKEILEKALQVLEKDYVKCESKDDDDFSDENFPKNLNAPGRCHSCRLGEVIEFLKDYISLF